MVTNVWQATDREGRVEAVASVLSSGDALGYTADEIVDALKLTVDGAALQHDLEEMVDQGILDRRGIGRGALYTLMVPVRMSKAANVAGYGALHREEPTARKVG